MAGVVSALLRAGLAVKLGHLRQAAASYVSDRMDDGRASLTGYAVGAGFYAAAGIFMIAALLVGATALFRWVEMNYGLFTAFGATAGVLVVLTVICAIIAAASMNPKKKNYPSLGSRLKAALHAAPAKSATNRVKSAPPPAPLRRSADRPDHVAAARDTAASVLRSPATPRSAATSLKTPAVGKVGAAAAVGLLGWALARRYNPPSVPAQAKRSRR